MSPVVARALGELAREVLGLLNQVSHDCAIEVKHRGGQIAHGRLLEPVHNHVHNDHHDDGHHEDEQRHGNGQVPHVDARLALLRRDSAAHLIILTHHQRVGHVQRHGRVRDSRHVRHDLPDRQHLVRLVHHRVHHGRRSLG